MRSPGRRRAVLAVALVLLTLLLALFLPWRAWRAAAPPPAAAVVTLDDFETYADDAGARAAWPLLSGDVLVGKIALERRIRASGRAALRWLFQDETEAPRGALGRRTGGAVPSNWSAHATFACAVRSLAPGPGGGPETAIGAIGDRGDHLYLEVEAPAGRAGRWRRVKLLDERNRRYLSWSGWSRWQVDLKGDADARGIDWRHVRAFRIGANGSPHAAYFIYLDDCRLERAWRPVQTPEYFFLGVNMWDLWGRGTGPLTGADLRRPFDAALRRDIETKLAYLAAKRIPVLRIFLDYHLEIDPGRGVFENEILRRLDFVMDTIRARGYPIRLMISLSTGYDVQTGISWYARQVPGDRYAKTRAFYTDPRLRAVYKRQIAHVLGHVNAGTGTAWKDEPLIWSWDVSNEPRILYGTPGTSYASRTRDMVAWYAEMSAHLRAIDGRHRIVSGTFYSGDGVEPHAEDYDDWNIWELFTLDTIDALSVQSYVGPHLLRSGPKPILLEEFGYGGRYFVGPTDAKRADNYRWMLLSDEKVFLSGVGALLWQMNWNHGEPDGKEIHAMPPSWRPLFSPSARNRSLDVFDFYAGKYNRLEVEPEIEEGWSDLAGLRWNWRSIHPPLRAVPGARFGEGYVLGPGRVENRLFVPVSARYRLRARVRGGAGGSAPFEVRVDGGPWLALRPGRAAADASGWRDAEPASLLDLRYGKHVVEIRIRETGAALDRYRLITEGGHAGCRGCQGPPAPH